MVDVIKIRSHDKEADRKRTLIDAILDTEKGLRQNDLAVYMVLDKLKYIGIEESHSYNVIENGENHELKADVKYPIYSFMRSFFGLDGFQPSPLEDMVVFYAPFLSQHKSMPAQQALLNLAHDTIILARRFLLKCAIRYSRLVKLDDDNVQKHYTATISEVKYRPLVPTIEWARKQNLKEPDDYRRAESFIDFAVLNNTGIGKEWTSWVPAEAALKDKLYRIWQSALVECDKYYVVVHQWVSYRYEAGMKPFVGYNTKIIKDTPADESDYVFKASVAEILDDYFGLSKPPLKRSALNAKYRRLAHTFWDTALFSTMLPFARLISDLSVFYRSIMLECTGNEYRFFYVPFKEPVDKRLEKESECQPEY